VVFWFRLVRLRVAGTPTSLDDGNVPGTYELAVDAGLEPGEQASAALDRFAVTVAIGKPEDFAITVLDIDGVEIEPGDADSYTLEDHAVFVGSIDPTEIPEPVSPGAVP
jgi:hypothetical protein